MRNLFRAFERHHVDFLLISGQASILYGAATFSEDVDIWLRPGADNVRRFLAALADRRARVHKLTPPMSERNLRFGHGFHFVIPGRPLPVYLDVMGQPPRVGSFASAKRRAVEIACEWGRLPVVSIEDLIALKRTRRSADYDVISNLVRRRLAAEEVPSRAHLRWAARSTFRPEDRAYYLSRLETKRSVERCAADISREVLRHQRADARYWRAHLAELRRMRRKGALLPEGAPVASLP